MEIPAFADDAFLARMAGAAVWRLGGIGAIQGGDPAGAVCQPLNGDVSHTFF